MMRYITILGLILFFTNCNSLEGTRYYLSKKQPVEVEIKELFFKNDSTAILMLKDRSFKIGYYQPNKNYVIIKEVEQDISDLPFEKGDSITIFRKELYYFKNNYKLVFEKLTKTNDLQ